MWFGTEEDSPTNKAKGLRCSPSFFKRCDSTVHRLHPRARKAACVRVRARAYTRACGCIGARLYLI
nr:MAG TPA: hypothetical protein [Microviridae sp.]